jgi:periplasmic divalent cation tolerance protein
MTETVVVLVTAPSAEKAAEIARAVVLEKLAACGNVIPGIRSIYAWEGKIHDEAEALLVLKVPRKRFQELCDRIVALHPYEVPSRAATSATSTGSSSRCTDRYLPLPYHHQAISTTSGA